MNWFNFGRKAAKRETSTSTSESEKSVSTISHTENVYNLQQALQLDTAFHAMKLRADALALAKLSYERFIKAQGVWEEWSDGPHSEEWRRLNWLMQVKPNRWQNATQMWQLASFMRDGIGRAGIYLRRGTDGSIIELEPCTYQRIIMRGEETLTVSLVFSDLCIAARPEDVLCLSLNSNKDFLELGIVQLAQKALSRYATACKLQLSMVGKGNQKRFIVRQEKSSANYAGLNGLQDSEMDANVENMNRQYASGDDFIFDPSASQTTEISQSFQDVMTPTNEMRKIDIEAIGRYFGVPSPLMFASSNAVYKSTDDAYLMFNKLTMEPIYEALEDEASSKILVPEDYGHFRLHFKRHALCLDGHKTKAETYKILTDAGIMTRNEVRQELNLPLKPELDAAPQSQTPKNTEE